MKNINSLYKLKKTKNKNSNNNTIILNFTNKIAGKNKLTNNLNNDTSDTIINYKQIQNKKIHFTYQYAYKNKKSVTGFGDFIRGLYFMLQFSEKYNIDILFNINKHYIKNYLEYFINNTDIDDTIEQNIPFIEINNATYNKDNNIINYTYIDIDKQLCTFISELSFFNTNDVYLYSINHPNEKLISEIHKQQVQDILKPTTYISTLVDKAINNLNLIKHHFITIHIRTNDDCFSNKLSIYNKQLNYIVQNIKLIYENNKSNILILSSDNRIKKAIIQFIPYVKCIFNEICHTCDNKVDNTQIENTLKEFYLMSYSSHIYSFSVYEHGSGFSKWCATTYNIPYICYFLNS